MNKVLLFFSGGNDSTLSAYKLACEGYEVYLVTFDNGCEVGIENVQNRATTLERLFSHSSIGKIKNLGVFQSVSSFSDLRYISGNIPFSEILEKYGDLNINQINCLNCRSAMYIMGVLIAKRLGITNIAEGARKTQLFAIEQENILRRYQEILSAYGIKLLLPVYEKESDYEVQEELQFISDKFYQIVHEGTTHYEAKCWLGMPMERELSPEELQGYEKFLESIVKPRMINRINDYPESAIDFQLKNPTYSKILFK